MYRQHFYVMEIWIKTLTGASLQLLVSPYDSIYNIKFRIQKIEGIPMSQQHLIWQSVELEDDRTLHEYQIHNGATLQLVLGMRGGPVNTRRAPSEEPTVQDMADLYLAEYLSETRGEPLSPSGGHPVTYIVYQTGDHFNLYCVFDRDGSSASNHRELLFSRAELNDDKDSPVPCARREENERTREKMQLVRSQMENMSLMKERKTKPSRKGQTSRPVSRQKSHHLAGGAATARPPSSFNKNAPLPPIGTTAPTAASLSPASDSSASVPLGLSATPAAETWSRAQCSSALLNVESDGMSPLVHSATLTPNIDEVNIAGACSSQAGHVLTDTAVVEDGSKHGGRYDNATTTDRRRTESPSQSANALGDGPSLQICGLAVEPSTRQLGSNAAGSVSEVQPDCSLSPGKISPDFMTDLPPVSPGSARLKLTDAACQCDEQLSDVKICASDDDGNKQLLASATGTDGASCCAARPLSNRSKNVDWWSKELASATSVLGLSPSPTRRLRSGGSSGGGSRAAAARKFHGLNAREMQTMSTVLNSIARSQSRATGSTAAAAGTTAAAGAKTAEPRAPTAERVRLTSARSQLRKLSAGRSRGSAGFRLPSVKVAVRKKSGKRCNICGKKTRLTNGFQCRCGNNFCSLHRYAEAHACTYDYKSEGRKLIEQNNPVVTAPKLPKI